MKNLTASALILAAALTGSVTTAFAQNTGSLKAEIPFNFHVGNQEFKAGTYETTMIPNSNGVRALRIANTDTGVVRLIIANIAAYPNSEAERVADARLVFTCAGSSCALSQLWPGYLENGMAFLPSSAKPSGPTHLAVIRLQAPAAD